ncbi:hypothetical protein CTI12_AA033070 [Artemisia annua]|uniref:Bifunctional inhibitor/plant lipid transfer protein/seed storage helical domain-containing protein n=1 Tax=Artemisia annua TaxID=35608 RepID=A0A2U1QGC3_ARTAN|nr:hypothetical protein CTI12_AA033070 [Artemisia annua]
MKFSGILVISMVMMMLLTCKVQSCDNVDIASCAPSINNPSIPASADCCKALDQHRSCLCFYQETYRNIRDVVDPICFKWNPRCV